MGVKTSSQLFKRVEEKGVIESGPKAIIKDSPDAILVFRFPTPVRGESHVSLDVGEKKNNISVTTKIKLTDGKIEIPGSWKSRKKDIYKKTLIAAGFENVSYMPDGKEKIKVIKEFTYFAGHPDNKDDEKINGKIAIKVKGEKLNLDVVNGIVTTEDKVIYNTLLRKGFYEAKSAEEIKE